MASYRALDWVFLEPKRDRVQVGDYVSIEAGGMPIFRVEAVQDGQIKLIDERQAYLHLPSLDGFRWRAAAA